MARVASLAAEVTADIGPLKTQMQQAGRSVQDFTRRARTEGQRFDRSMQQATRSSGAFGRGIQNAAFQVGDFAVQVGGGTSAVRAMSMQLPQLLGGFGVLGAVAGAAVAIIGPLAQSLWDTEEASNAASSAMTQAFSSLSNVRSTVDEIRSLTERYNAAIAASGPAQSAASQTILANLGKELGLRREIFRVQSLALRREIRELGRHVEQEVAARNQAIADRMGQLINLPDSVTGPGRFDPPTPIAPPSLGLGGAESLFGEDRNLALEEMRAQLELLRMAANDANEALDQTIMGDTPAAVSAVGGGGGGRAAKSPVVQQIQTISEELKHLTDLTKGELSEQVGAWGRYFDHLNTVSGAGSRKLAATAKALGAIEATINAYRAATQALADPTVPFWGKAAAYASVLATGLGAVNAIKGASIGGGAGGGGTGAVAAASAPGFSQSAVIQLNGSENAMFSKSQVRDLINAINEAVEGGARIRLA